jgi:hypothetical protein
MFGGSGHVKYLIKGDWKDLENVETRSCIICALRPILLTRSNVERLDRFVIFESPNLKKICKIEIFWRIARRNQTKH